MKMNEEILQMLALFLAKNTIRVRNDRLRGG